MTSTATVVVGIDGSAESRAALLYALQDAGRRAARLRVVVAVPVPDRWGTAFGMGMYGMGVPPTTADIVAELRAAARRAIDEVTQDEPVLAARVEIGIVTGVGPPAEVLLSASHDADLLVVGHRGLGGFSSALLGSVGLQCVLHATCPVTVVRPTATPEDAPHRDDAAAAPA